MKKRHKRPALERINFPYYGDTEGAWHENGGLYTEIVSATYTNGRKEMIASCENPEPPQDTIALVVSDVNGNMAQVMAWTPEEFKQHALLCVLALGHDFEIIRDFLAS